MKRKFFLLLSLCSLIGCMVGPDYEQPSFFSNERVSEALGITNQSTATEIPFKLGDLHDETLNKLLRQAMHGSPSLRIAKLRLRESRQNLRIQEAAFFPTFDFSGKYNYEKEGRNMGTSAKLNDNYYMAGIDAAWEIDIFGGTRRQTEAAKALARAEMENLKGVYVSLRTEVALNYLAYRTTEELLKKAFENKDIQSGVYDLIQDQFATGLTSQIVLSEGKYQLENINASIPSLESQKTGYANSLALLLGMLPGELDALLGEEADDNIVNKTFSYELERLYDLPVGVLRNRPDIKAAEEQLIAQNALVGAAVAELFPAVNLSAFFGFSSLQFGTLLQGASAAHSYVPSLTAPIFHFGALWNNVKVQKIIKEQDIINYEQTILTAAQDIKNVLVALAKEKIRNEALNTAYQEINMAADLTRDKYKSGLVDYSSVLDAEQRRITAQTDLVNSNSLLYQNIVKFYKAIGGEFGTIRM